MYILTCTLAILSTLCHGLVFSPCGFKLCKRLCEEHFGCRQVKYWNLTCSIDGDSYNQVNRNQISQCPTQLCRKGWRLLVTRGSMDKCSTDAERVGQSQVVRRNVPSLLVVRMIRKGRGSGHILDIDAGTKTPYNYISYAIEAIACNRNLQKLYFATDFGRLVRYRFFSRSYKTLLERIYVKAMAVDEEEDILIFTTASSICTIKKTKMKKIKTRRTHVSIAVDSKRKIIYSCDNKSMFKTSYPVLKCRLFLSDTGSAWVALKPNFDVLYYDKHGMMSEYSFKLDQIKELFELKSPISNLLADGDRLYYSLEPGLIYEYDVSSGTSCWLPSGFNSSSLFVACS